MATRKEQEIRLRREVRDIINSHMRETPFSLDNFVDDIMGAINQEDNYRVKDYMEHIEIQRRDMIAQMEAVEAQNRAEINKLKTLLEEKNSKIDKLKSELTSDTIKKELERKIAILQDKNKTLKKLVQLSLEEM